MRMARSLTHSDSLAHTDTSHSFYYHLEYHNQTERKEEYKEKRDGEKEE